MKLTALVNDSHSLEQKIKALPPRHPYYVYNCELPLGCSPQQATLAFNKIRGFHEIYLDGYVQYSGNNDAMHFLCSGQHKLFSSYQEMWQFFRELPPEPAPPPESAPPFQPIPTAPPSISPGSPPETLDLSGVTSMNEITIPSDTGKSKLDYKTLKRELEKSIVGQTEAMEALAYQSVRHLSKPNPHRPMSALFSGPPGTGKSQAAKELAKILSQHSGHEYQTVWTELNTFTEAHSVYRLTGSPPGYVGYDDKPVLEAVSNNPYTVFIFDELDKAHNSVLTVLMSILDEGRIAARKELANYSREFDFKHCIFIFTSNFCLDSKDQKKIGFTLSSDVKEISFKDSAVEVDYLHDEEEGNENVELTKRIFHNNETARKRLIEAGVLREIASRFQSFISFKELTDEAKIQILAKLIIESGFEFDLKISYVAPGVLQALVNASLTGDALTVRSFRSVIDGYLAESFAEAGARYPGQQVRLDGTIDAPSLIPEASQNGGGHG